MRQGGRRHLRHRADEVNLVASTIAKFEFQAPRVIARVNNPINSWLFNLGMGVDASVNQADIISHMVVEEMSMKSLMTLMQLSRGGYSIIQLTVQETSQAIGKAIKDIKLPSSCLMIAIYRGETMLIPHGNTTIFRATRSCSSPTAKPTRNSTTSSEA